MIFANDNMLQNRVCVCVLGMRGPLHSAGPAVLTWAGSSQPWRRIWVLRDSGVWHVLRSYPQSLRARRVWKAPACSACDLGLIRMYTDLDHISRPPSRTTLQATEKHEGEKMVDELDEEEEGAEEHWMKLAL